MLVLAPVSKVSLSEWCREKTLKWGDCLLLRQGEQSWLRGGVGTLGLLPQVG